MSERSEANPLVPPLAKGEIRGIESNLLVPPLAKGDAGGFDWNRPPGDA
jgi:hypothetical protein